MRRSYEARGLAEIDLAGDWVTQFRRWLDDAIAADLPEPNAMVLATADADGRPSARTVLLKGYDVAGLVFYTNYRSRKGRELAANPWASVVFPWIALARQVVVVGRVERVPADRSDAYFASRPHGSQVGAAASPQSEVVPDRAALDAAWGRVGALYPDGTPVPRPEHWGGFLLRPETVEFWQGQVNRMHDRLRYRRAGRSGADAGVGTGAGTGGEWVVERLAP
ncbi:MAG: pyridoxamine 5'-phosphate oxidase [Mycobacteriales bacterium]